MKNSQSDFFRTTPTLIKLLFLILVLIWSPRAISQQTAKNPQKIGIINQSKQTIEEPQKRTISPPNSVSELTGFILTPRDSGAETPQMAGGVPIEEPTWMEFTLDWTNCQIHRVKTDSAIVIILPGAISSSNSIYWNLSAMSLHPGVLPTLHFVEDVLGRTGPNYGADIPLTWEISVDGSPFNPVTIQSDSSLSVNFPSGKHTFQVRITSAPPPYQGDGYYQLRLGQSLVPEL